MNIVNWQSMDDKYYNPLVSIIIASYNAEEYIRETLHSCIEQTYRNIEIIITDDYSSDNTISVCNEWIKEEKLKRHDLNVTVLTNDKNTGTVKNFNRAISVCNGEWIKFIGSDDILLTDAISQYINFIHHHQKKSTLGAVFAKFKTFSDTISIKENVFPQKYTEGVIKMKSGWLKKKVINLHFNNVAPSAFVNSSVLRTLGGFDENYIFLEDLPFWMKMVMSDVDIAFIDKVSVLYRIHKNQVTHSSTSGIKNILLTDLLRLNQLRKENGHYVAYLHHRYQFWLKTRYITPPRIMRFLDPIEFFIYGVDKVTSGR